MAVTLGGIFMSWRMQFVNRSRFGSFGMFGMLLVLLMLLFLHLWRRGRAGGGGRVWLEVVHIFVINRDFKSSVLRFSFTRLFSHRLGRGRLKLDGWGSNAVSRHENNKINFRPKMRTKII